MNGDRAIEVTKEVVSISEMARMLGFSRARIYQLIHEGVLSKPTKTAVGGRPFFTRKQQEECIEVRRKNRGVNGKAILFYSMRTPSSAPPTTPARQARQRRSSQRPQQTGSDARISALRQGLTQLGMGQVSDASIRTALTETYSDGWSNVDQPELLRS